MRIVLTLAASAALLVACSPPAQRPEAPPEQPAVAACNSVAPNANRQVAVVDAVAAAAAASDLRGGAITPGVYDLVSASRMGAATGWSGTRAVALEVSESGTGGVTFNWNAAAPDGGVDSWTGAFPETQPPRRSFTGGRVGEIPAAFEAQADRVQLRLQDGAGGQLALSFQRRA